ncbi:hypothetical protein [Roseinatronobacter sp.]
MDLGLAKEMLGRDIAQRTHAVVLLDQVRGFVDDLRGAGFGVAIEVGALTEGMICVGLDFTCPDAFPPDEGETELVDAGDAPVVPAAPEPEPAAPVTADAAPLEVQETAPVRAGQPWTPKEDAELVRLRADCVGFEEISEKLGRPVPGLQYRCSKVLQREIADAVAAKNKPAPVKPAPEAAAPRPVARPAGQNFSPIVPDSCGDDITGGLMEAHLRWLYGDAPDTDSVACDLQLVEMLARGDGAQAVATEFDWPKEQVLSRWHALRGGASVTLNLQRVLLDALRALASGAAA